MTMCWWLISVYGIVIGSLPPTFGVRVIDSEQWCIVDNTEIILENWFPNNNAEHNIL